MHRRDTAPWCVFGAHEGCIRRYAGETGWQKNRVWATHRLMRLLLTNDDGISAPGLALVHELLSELGEVWVIAPDQERSGVSHAITLFRPLRLEEVRPRWFRCSGTPTDCVYLALNQMELDVDLVVSGINAGPNLAHDVLYSGTVSAALEGAHWGIPSIALSHCSGDTRLLPELRDVLRKVLEVTIPISQRVQGAVNVNIPPANRMPFRGVVATSLGHRVYSNEVHQRADPRGRDYYWIGGAKVTMKDMPGSDCNAVRDNFISVTPLGNDLTLHRAVAAVDEALRDVAQEPVGRQPAAADEPTLSEKTIGFPFE